MLSKIIGSVSKDICAYPTRARAGGPTPICSLHGVSKTSAMRNKHWRCVGPEVFLAQNRQRPADQVPGEIKSHLQEISRERRHCLLDVKLIFIAPASTWRDFSRPPRPVALATFLLQLRELFELGPFSELISEASIRGSHQDQRALKGLFLRKPVCSLCISTHL